MAVRAKRSLNTGLRRNYPLPSWRKCRNDLSAPAPSSRWGHRLSELVFGRRLTTRYDIGEPVKATQLAVPAARCRGRPHAQRDGIEPGLTVNHLKIGLDRPFGHDRRSKSGEEDAPRGRYPRRDSIDDTAGIAHRRNSFR
jgi:hypothetical protein